MIQHQRIWVVGATKGIGRALVQQLDQPNKTLILSARNLSDLNEVAASLKHAEALLCPLDIASEAGLQHSRQWLLTTIGHLDALIMNAGTCEYIDHYPCDIQLVKHVMNTNFLGAVEIINIGLALLRKADSHRLKTDPAPLIAVLSSSVTYQALPRAGAYGASKAALRYYVESMKVHVDAEGIDLRLISPGFVKTPLTDRNDFPMPLLQTPEQAAHKILRGLAGHRFDIAFPRLFIWSLKTLSYLPIRLKYRILSKLCPPPSNPI